MKLSRVRFIKDIYVQGSLVSTLGTSQGYDIAIAFAENFGVLITKKGEPKRWVPLTNISDGELVEEPAPKAAK
jgi:hypothetical protein